MTLDLAMIAGQIAEMVEAMDPASERHRFSALHDAWDNLDSADVSARLYDAKTTFLVPGRHRDYKGRRSLPAGYDGYTVAGADGSFILPSRHSPARYYLINTGGVLLRYGEEPSAEFQSEPRLYFRDEDMTVPGDELRRTPINGTVIGPKRAVDELVAVAGLLEDEDGPAVALQDGTLVLWALETLPDSVADWVLPQFIEALQTFRDRGQPVAGYISAPGSNELMNLLRIAVCDYPPQGMTVNCDHCRGRIATEGHTPACDILPQVTDRYLFGEVADLQPGERSAIYASTSRILDRYREQGGEDMTIRYFYVNVGFEIGRVEIPGWVADNSGMVDLVHHVVCDQARLGRGYPVVLQEAHELAVLSTSDRRLMEDHIERELAQHGIVLTYTGKDGSKRGRFV